jgi:hypothetical protein
MAQADYADVAHQDLVRPDGWQLRQMLAGTARELATGRCRSWLEDDSSAISL